MRRGCGARTLDGALGSDDELDGRSSDDPRLGRRCDNDQPGPPPDNEGNNQDIETDSFLQVRAAKKDEGVKQARN